MVLAQTKADRIDVTLERSIRPSENPELRDDLGITLVKLCAEHETIAVIARHPELFQDHLRTLFGTLQRPRYLEALAPKGGVESRALVFQLPFPELDCRFLLERVPAAREGRCFLRITIEDPAGRRLDLASLPHVVVEDLEERCFIAGSTRIAQTLAEGVRREAERGRRMFDEIRRPHTHLFRQFAKAGLSRFQKVHVSWGDAFVPCILESEPRRLEHLMKRVLLALEDTRLRQLLARQAVLRIDADTLSVYVDASELGRVLNFSLGRRRERLDIDHFLERMPCTMRVVAETGERGLAGVSIFLIHHMTAEVLGLIAGLRRLGCTDLTCLFVAYAGDPPGSYLGPLLELPQEEFRCLALTNVPQEDSVEGYYRLSAQYSSLDHEEELIRALQKHGNRWYDAMQAVAVLSLQRQLRHVGKRGGKLLLIEDGGYLAPRLNRACLQQQDVHSFLGDLDTEEDDARPLREVLDEVLLGTVEHTRNGFDRLVAVEGEHGGLAFPAFSIAVSRLKVEREAQEVATSVLNAVENVLHGVGRVLSRRNCIVLGSRGAIGSRLVASLNGRLNDPAGQLAGVDLASAAAQPATTAFPEARHYRDLPEQVRLRVDLFLGVIGASILEGEDLEEWLLRGHAAELILASGSTKTEEFAGLASWMEARLHEANPRIGGTAARIETLELSDPLTGRLFGHRYRFHLGARPARDVIFLANLTPVNFMFYGVPTELIDEVLAQLLSCSLGLVRRSARAKIPTRLHAVDRDITASGDPL